MPIEQFQEWLTGRGYAHNTVNGYANAVNHVSEHYSQQVGKQVNLYEIDDVVLVGKIAQQYGIGGQFSEAGNQGHGIWRNAVARYAEFIAETNGENGNENDADAPNTGEDEQHLSNLKYERDLQNILCTQISKLFPNYKMLGKEYSINGKRIDVLLEHHNSKELLVVELKAGRADCAVFGQVAMYMGMLQRRQEFSDREIRGVIIAGSADEGLLYACKTNDNISLKLYRMTLELEDSDIPDIEDSES
ncbi:MAG: endonuclease NucS [Candidatus Zeuxoniibacter abyssi]|nr:MAG: endonuclease NucS [Candidatus Persebacteraceae bacterium AB1(2)]